MSRFAIGPLVLLLAGVQTSAQNVSPRAREVVQATRELRAIGLPNSLHDFQNGPPSAVPGLLRQLNRQLRALIVETLNDPNRHAVPSADEITTQLRSAGWEEIPDYKWNAYGEIIQINFDWQIGYDPAILIVSTQLWIPCGSSDPDVALYVFQGRAREWQLAMAADADFDSASASPDTGMQYRLSPPAANGAWFLAIAHTPPSCRAAPAELRYEVLRPGRSAEEPTTLLSRRERIYQKFNPPFRLRTETDWFAITAGKLRKLDGEPGLSISRYMISGQQAVRVQPLALTPEDFLDEWASLSWDQAGAWSNESMQPDLREWHSKLNRLTADSTELEFVQPCPKQEGSDSTWLLGLWIDQKQNPSSEDERLYITVSERAGAQYVDGIRKNRPAGCPGSASPRIVTDWSLPYW